jgi:hypothetical protein
MILRTIILIGIVTVLSGLVFGSVQQSYRQNANDPQIQLAEDAATKLEANPRSFVISSENVDIAKSLAPFIILYDDSYTPIAGSGTLNGKLPAPPEGVFEYTKLHKQHRVTWQPQSDVRIAAVFVRVEGQQAGYVLAGRSLREVEVREKSLSVMVFLGWLASLGVIVLIKIISFLFRSRKFSV